MPSRFSPHDPKQLSAVVARCADLDDPKKKDLPWESQKALCVISEPSVKNGVIPFCRVENLRLWMSESSWRLMNGYFDVPVFEWWAFA